MRAIEHLPVLGDSREHERKENKATTIVLAVPWAIRRQCTRWRRILYKRNA